MAIIVTIVSASAPAFAQESRDAASIYLPKPSDGLTLAAAIERERPGKKPPEGVTGITVPHHLLAADLIARGFWAASANDYDRIIILSPDHFRAVRGHFGIIVEDVTTLFGPLRKDEEALAQLLAKTDLFEPLQNSHKEHGIHAVTPFIRHFFPETPVVAVVASVGSEPADWAAAANALRSLLTSRTLVIQSTDFSHYLPLPESIRRDQQTLSTIATGANGAVSNLNQPGHLDSKASQFIQMELQARINSQGIAIANRNSTEYSPGDHSTTSYIVMVYTKNPSAGSSYFYDDQTILYFGGDVLLGRYFSPFLINFSRMKPIVEYIYNITGGKPLIVNLEGALMSEAIVGLGDNTHQMLSELAGPVIRELNIVAASLANNHSMDFGEAGLEETKEQLGRLGVRPLLHGEVTDMGAFRIVALNFIRGRWPSAPAIEGASDIARLCELAADPPLFAFVHWGVEYTSTHRDIERRYTEIMRRCGITLVVGAHSHKASSAVEAPGEGDLQRVFSLGNLLFDQAGARASSALLEVRIFRQGTVATRLIPVANLYDLTVRNIESSQRRNAADDASAAPP